MIKCYFVGNAFGYLNISGPCFVLIEDKRGLQLKLEHAGVGSELNRNGRGGWMYIIGEIGRASCRERVCAIV